VKIYEYLLGTPILSIFLYKFVKLLEENVLLYNISNFIHELFIVSESLDSLINDILLDCSYATICTGPISLFIMLDCCIWAPFWEC